MKVALVVPAFNESDTIANVVAKISIYGVPIVVNDCSTDNTAQLALAAGAIVISHAVNIGYDAALATGLAKAMGEDFDYAITFDGDGQHEPSRIESVLNELIYGADLVVGIRDRCQRFSESLFAWFTRILWGISDPLCGMKGYRLSKLKGVRSLCSYRSIGTELTIRGVRSGWKVGQVPVTMIARKGQSRFGSGFYANWLIFRAMLHGLIFARSFSMEIL